MLYLSLSLSLHTYICMYTCNYNIIITSSFESYRPFTPKYFIVYFPIKKVILLYNLSRMTKFRN